MDDYSQFLSSQSSIVRQMYFEHGVTEIYARMLNLINSLGVNLTNNFL